MSTTSAVPPGPAPVHFGRRSSRGLLLGLSTARCVSVATAAIRASRAHAR